MRGSLTLFADIFETPAPPKLIKKGRSSELNDKRNECLSDRYYYYAQFTEKKYTAIITTLADEFFLSVVTVSEILVTQTAYIKHTKSAQTTKNDLARKWPRFAWK